MEQSKIDGDHMTSSWLAIGKMKTATRFRSDFLTIAPIPSVSITYALHILLALGHQARFVRPPRVKLYE